MSQKLISDQKLTDENNAAIVLQSNDITYSYRGDLKLSELDVLYYAFSKFKSDDPSGKIYTLEIKEMEKWSNGQINYKHVRNAALSLKERLYRIRKGNEVIKVTILQGFTYVPGAGTIELEFSDDFYPYFFGLEKNYTLFDVSIAKKLKSKYSRYIYEMLCRWRDTRFMKISVEQLKACLGLIDFKTGKEKYTEFGLFATKILDPAKKDINENTDITFDYTTKKTSRKITGLEFEEYLLISKYSKRLYEMLSQFKKQHEKDLKIGVQVEKECIMHISVRKLKEIFGLIDLETDKDTYSDFFMFVQNFLEPARKEINENTNINFEYVKNEYVADKVDHEVIDLDLKISYKKVTKGLLPSSSEVIDKTPKRTVETSNEDHTPKREFQKLPPEQAQAYLELYAIPQKGGLGWLRNNRSLAYKLVTQIPVQKLWKHIGKVKRDVQSGNLTYSITTYFTDILDTYSK